MQLEELYTALYSKYAPNLSQEELGEKIKYASTLDPNDFISGFYQKYTGQGPNQEQVDYMNSMLQQPEVEEIEQPKEDSFQWSDIVDLVKKTARSTTPSGYASVISEEAVKGTLTGPDQSTFSTIANIGGEYADALRTGWSTGMVLEENLEVFKGNHSPEAIEAMVKAGEKLNNLPQNDRMIKFAKAVDESGGGFFNGLLELAKQDDGGVLLASQVAVQSLAMMAAGGIDSLGDVAKGKTPDALAWMAAGAGTGALVMGTAGSVVPGLGNLIGAGTGAITGTLGGLSTALENGLTFTELLKEEIEASGEEYNKDTAAKFLANKDNYNRIKSKALNRGLTIGAVDMIGGGIASALGIKTARALGKTVKVGGKTLKSTTTRGALAGVGAATVAEGISGGTGEFLGQKAAGQEYNAADIILEAFAETPGAIVTGPTKQLFRDKPKYTITQNNTTVEYNQEEFLKKIDGIDGSALTKLDIKIEGDDMLASELFDIQNDAIIRSQIDPTVPDGPEKDRLVQLEKDRRKAEADSKLTGIRKKPGAKDRLDAINQEIESVLDKFKYAEFDPDTRAEVKERKRIKEEVGKARTQIFLDNLNKKLAKQGKKQLKDIKDLAAYVEKKTGKVFNVESGDSVKMEEHLKRVQGREKLNKGESQRFGSMTPVMDDAGNVISYDLFVNEETAYKANGDLNVAAHEFFHGAIFATLQGNIEAQMVLGNALISALKSKNAKLKEGSDLNERIAAYEENEGQGEEILTLVSSAMLNNEIEINEGFMQDLRDVWRRFGQKYLGREIKFDTDQDVLNFIKDFNKTVKDPSKMNQSMLDAIGEGIQGKLLEDIDVTKGPKVGDTTFSKEASDNVQRIYNEQGEAGAMDIIDVFKPITSKIVERRSEAPNFDRQLLTDEIETGQRGIFDLIREYKPESGVPLAAYINKFLPARAIEASKRVLGEEFTEDVTEKVDIAAEEVAEPTVAAKPKPKKIVLADRLGISDKVEKAISKIIPGLDVENLTFKNLKNKIPNITGKLFGISPKKIISGANITKSELQSAQMFINKNADLLIQMLPEGATAGGVATGIPNTLLKAFYTKTDRAKMAKTGTKAGLAIQQKNNIKKSDFLETFGIIDGKPNRTDRNTSARVLALANTLGKMITNQAIRQQVKAENLKTLEDGKSVTMFSKADRAIAEEFKQGNTYYDINDLNSVEQYVNVDVPRIVEVFKEYPGLISGNELVNGLNAIKNPELKKALRDGVKGITKKGKYPKREFSKHVGKKVSDMNESRIKEFNKQAGINFDAHWIAIDKALSKDPTLLGPILIYLSNAQNSRTHIHRAGAEFIAYDKTVKGDLYLEHALQNVNAYRTLIRASMNDKTKNRSEFKKALKALKENYKLIGVSVADNKKLDDSGYKLEMPKNTDGSNWSIFNNSWWQRYSNEKINDLGGINFENFNVVGSKNNLAQEYNIPILKPQIKANEKFVKAVSKSRTMASKPPKGITVLDFDDTLATTESLVKFTRPDGTTGTLNAEQYASTYEDLLDQGYTFDFSDFNKVVKGKLAPLFQKALKLQGKFGPENMFVLTARPPAAQKAIFDFLKANGLNIPLKNITGLANSTSEAKALWIADKVGEGFNDFYFADDALQNVQAVKNMLDQFDVKSKVQQARTMFSKNLDKDFNNILEEVTGIDAVKRFSDTKARKRGESKGKFRFFIPPSHEDFVGLLYNFMGKGRKGDGHRNFFEQALIRPLNRAYREIDTAKQAIANDYKSLNKQFPDVKKKLVKNTPNGDFTFQDAIRVYLWNKHGYTIPGLTKTDQQNLVDIVMKDSELQAYAETLNTISKQETYVDPGPNWETGNIRIDLVDATGRVGRASYFTEFNENVDIIFSPENLNKIEAAYGKDFREALEDMLHRIKTGVNRPKGASAKPNIFMNWLNASVSGVMFFNTRSSLLQQMSNVNFLNFADNNIYAAGKAFANQPQYWKDFAMIFNSDMLKQRRGGLQTDINGAEMAEAIKKARPGNMFDQVSIIVGKALRLGFLPTQIGDNIAIATGGAAFYRNRVNKYIKDGLSKKEAESKAFIDLQDITNSTQQSARPDMTSAQQASWVGKLILNFLNTPSQYNRIIKKAGSDIKNRRITPPNTSQMQSDMSNMSRILYYGAAQNLIFYGLQTALFAVMFGLEDDDEEKRAEQFLKKKERVINGSIDTILRGSGIYGVAVSTLKNMIIKFAEQREKGYNKDESAVLMEALNFSPVVGIRARSIVNAEKTVNYNEKVIKEMETFDIDNPMWSAVTNYVQVTGLPANRVYQKTINLRNASDNQYTAFQRALFFSGYTTWSLNLGDTQKMKDIKEKVKSKKKKLKTKKKKKTFRVL